MAFNHAFVRYELGEYEVAVRALEKLIRPKSVQPASSPPDGVPGNSKMERRVQSEVDEVESKWVDLLIKSYVKVGRVGAAVTLTDKQLANLDPVRDSLVLARVALTVYPWRFGAGLWKDIGAHYTQLVRAAEKSLQLSPKEVEETSLRMTPHNSLIFLDNELGSAVVARYVSETYKNQPINGTYARLRVCPSCQYRARLRLGYLLWEVRESDVLYTLIAGLLQHHARQHDPPQVRVYTLTRRPPPDSLRFPANSLVTFVSFSGVAGREAAQVIRREKTEVLLDLTTHGDLSGAHILQHLPAPIQVGYLGYPGPKLAQYMNSSIWDRKAQPPELVVPAVWRSERLVYAGGSAMPSSHTTLFARRPSASDALAQRQALNISDNTTVLCNFLQTWKIQEPIFHIWMLVMRRKLTDAVLVLWEQSADTRDNLGREALARGVPLHRIRFVTRTDDLESYHRRLSMCDLFLDTPFYNAGSTTPTVLWTGVPILTTPGNRTAARLATGFVLGGSTRHGPGETLGRLTVARTAGEYAELLPLLARRHSKGWKAVRRALAYHRDNAHTHGTLFSTEGYARDMERVGIALRRLGAAEPDAASKYHLILA
eukprot:Tamp_03212.p1 GENE.Tamp_03212~~Tamp_03212.p1  ORF type:complete len:685 (+),score=107.63 Tamp_03212:259-2055(+)